MSADLASSTSVRVSLTPGVVLGDEFQVTNLLAISTDCELWEASTGRGQRAIVKIAAAGRTLDVERLAHATSPGIARVLAHGETADGRAYCVTEASDGIHLRRLLCYGALLPRAAIEILESIRDALRPLHRQGLVHGRLQPEHVMIDETSRGLLAATLLGFGSTIGEGDPSYLAPEQLAGGHVDQRADVFAVAALAVAMLTGAGPFATSSFANEEIRAKRLAGMQPQFLPDIDPVLRRVLWKGLAEAPADRWATVEELVSALAAPYLARGSHADLVWSGTTDN